MDKQEYTNNGINYDEGLARFANKDVLYQKYLDKFLDDASYQTMVDMCAQGNAEEAFKAAHTLKGVSGNLSMNVLYKLTSDLVEDLRVGDLSHVDEKLPSITKKYEQTIEFLKNRSR